MVHLTKQTDAIRVLIELKEQFINTLLLGWIKAQRQIGFYRPRPALEKLLRHDAMAGNVAMTIKDHEISLRKRGRSCRSTVARNEMNAAGTTAAFGWALMS